MFLEIIIPRTVKSRSGKRIYDKVHHCPYCGEAFAKISRHIQKVHKTVEEVAELVKLPTKDKKLKLDLLRFKGSFVKNMKVLRIGGELQVWRRPAENAIVTHEDYLPCNYCLAFVTKSEMWRHVKKCPHKSSVVGGGDMVKRAELLLYPNQYDSGASNELRHLVLSIMNKDHITNVVAKDNIILTYGSFMLSTSGIRKVNGISQRMRILGRLLILLREKARSINHSMIDFMKPEYFDIVVECSKELGGFSLQNKEGENVASFSVPSLPLKIGYSLEKCCSLLNGIGIKSKNPSLSKDAVEFLQLFKLEWVAQISTVCLKTMDTNKFNKVMLLPLTEDLMKVRTFLKQDISKNLKLLNEDHSIESWRALAEALGTRLTIFNRRRGNEVFQVLASRFSDRHKWRDAEMAEIKESLTPLERRLMDR